MQNFLATTQVLHANKARRDYPGRDDGRCRRNILCPDFKPKFRLALDGGAAVFTIGSCFARNIEEALLPLGVRLPTRDFSVPPGEWGGRPNGLLNEFNPGTINQRIMRALAREESSAETLVPSSELWADLLLLPGAADVSRDRALQRRAEIDRVYEGMADCGVVIITLGFIEAWFDVKSASYLNRMPPFAFGRAHPDRFRFKRLDVFESFPLLEQAVKALSAAGKKVVLTVSPVPISTTFADADCIVANEFSKAVLRVCAERLCAADPNVDYFPAYEIVRSAGLCAYAEDNVHVRDELVREITGFMVQRYAL